MDQRLRAFCATAEAESVSRAAAKLGVTQSALSKMLRRVEQEYGTRLFNRTAGGVTLNEAGRALYRRAERASAELTRAREEIVALQSKVSGSVKICAGPVYLLDWIQRSVRDVAIRYPDISFEFKSSTTPQGIERLLKGELDAVFGVVDGKEQDEHVEIIFIKRVSTAIFGVGSHSSFSGSDELILDKEWVLASELSSNNRHAVDFWKGQFGREPRIRFRTDSIPAALALAADNDCLVCLPHPLAPLAAAHGLAPIAFGMPIWEFDTGCLIRRSSSRYQVLQALIHELKTKLS